MDAPHQPDSGPWGGVDRIRLRRERKGPGSHRRQIVGRSCYRASPLPAKYVGDYTIRGKGPVRIQFEDDHLIAYYGGRVRPIVQNETAFVSPRATFHFLTGAQGAVVRLL